MRLADIVETLEQAKEHLKDSKQKEKTRTEYRLLIETSYLGISRFLKTRSLPVFILETLFLRFMQRRRKIYLDCEEAHKEDWAESEKIDKQI